MWYYDRLTGDLLPVPAGFFGSTNQEPPLLTQRQCAKFVDGAWHVVADYRGVQFYRKIGGYPVSLGLGDLPGDDLVSKPLPSKFHHWKDDDWALDHSALRVDLLNRLANFRRSMETGGITVGGASIDTSRSAQAMLNQAYASLQAGFIQSVDWKGKNGWHTLGLAQVTAIAQAVAMHVEGCFTKEKVVSQQIDALADEEIAGFDIAAAWAAA